METVLEILKDGKWHSIKEIEEKTKIHEYKLQMIINFLTSFNFIEIRKDRGEVKAAPNFLKIMKMRIEKSLK